MVFLEQSSSLKTFLKCFLKPFTTWAFVYVTSSTQNSLQLSMVLRVYIFLVTSREVYNLFGRPGLNNLCFCFHVRIFFAVECFEIVLLLFCILGMRMNDDHVVFPLESIDVLPAYVSPCLLWPSTVWLYGSIYL